MGKLGGNKLNKGFIGVNKFSSSTEGIKNPRNDYLNQVVNATDISNLSPSFIVDFTGTTWQNQVSFSRGGTATFLGSSGYITVAGPNVPRIQYGLSGNTLGLLIEPSVGVRWSYNNVSITSWGRIQMQGTTAYDNVALAPDGTTTALWLVPTAVNAYHQIDALSGLAASDYDGYLTHSAFFKKQQYSAVALTIQRTAAPVYSYRAYVDLNNGNVYKEESSDGAYGYTVVEQYSNDWWRISVSMKAYSTGNHYVLIGVLRDSAITNNLTTYTGSGTGGIYFWGSNYHGVGAPVQYINQNGLVSKAGDVCYSSGNSFSSWYTYPGCFYMEYYNKPDRFNIGSRDAGNWNTVTVTSSRTVLATPYRDKNTFFVSNGEMIGNKTAFFECLADYMLSSNGKTGYQQLNKMACAVSGTTFPYTLRFSLNGSNVQSITTSNFDPKGITCMLFGSRGFLNASSTVPQPTAEYNGILKEFRFYNSNLTDDQIRALTT